MPGRSNSAVGRKELGASLRDLRLRAGLSIDAVHDRTGISTSQISRIETGQRTAKKPHVLVLCALYGVNTSERDRLLALTGAAQRREWWRGFALSDDYATVIGLEDAALSIKDFKSGVVTGLLQTEAYARAILTTPPLGRRAVDEQLAIRLERQKILDRPDPPEVDIILDEDVLHRWVGGPSTMRGQMARLITESERSKVRLRVVPFSAGAHPGIGSLFTIFRLPQPEVADVVYIESTAGDRHVRSSRDIVEIESMFTAIDNVALSPTHSRDLIRSVSKGFVSHS